MLNIKKKSDHGVAIPEFSRSGETRTYPFGDLSVGDFIEIFVDHNKDWEQEVMFEHDIVFAWNNNSNDDKVFRHQPLLAERLIRIWRIK